mmetsp:Transcript_11630/g.43715  ORF Transcript_11630/g.43715 Transcript_11630/m.43715 type:complete len:170 (+) Transcript_11630:1374-1883(+)
MNINDSPSLLFSFEQRIFFCSMNGHIETRAFVWSHTTTRLHFKHPTKQLFNIHRKSFRFCSTNSLTNKLIPRTMFIRRIQSSAIRLHTRINRYASSHVHPQHAFDKYALPVSEGKKSAWTMPFAFVLTIPFWVALLAAPNSRGAPEPPGYWAQRELDNVRVPHRSMTEK